MVGGVTHIDHDVPAYMIVSGQPAAVRAVNTIGLERRGFDKDTIKKLRTAFKVIYLRGHSLQEAIAELKLMREDCDALQVLIDSLEGSEKGIHR
jgi:UDP-N-acetylglucosamine acyltransferase